MRELSFRIRHWYGDRQGISLPIAVSRAGFKTAFPANLDTGASFSVFQRKHAEDLDIDVEAGLPMRFATVTGTFVAYAHDVMMEVLELEFQTTVYFADDPFMRRDVLGRTGWLDRIRLGLIDHDQLMYLSHYDD